MMRKTIVRTMSTSTIEAFKLSMVDGKPVAVSLEPITVSGKANEKEAMKTLKDKYGKDVAITIGKISINENTYEISVDDFVKYAKKVVKGSTEEPEEV